MRTGIQMKYVSKLTDARRASREDKSSLLGETQDRIWKLAIKKQRRKEVNYGERIGKNI